MMATVVPELVRLAEDLSLVRDLGRYETDLVYMRLQMTDLEQTRTSPVFAWDDVRLVSETVAQLALLQARLAECARRGLLG